jgi:hypothetical protein
MNKILTKQLSDQIVNWWAFFMEAEDKIADYFMHAIDFNVVEFMQDNLQCINRNLRWEFGPAISKKGHRLVITPETRKDLRPLVKAILAHAPELSNWEFYSYRLPEKFDSATSVIEVKTGYRLENLYFSGKRNEFNLIEVTVIFLNIKDETTLKIAQHQAVLMVEYLLGEEIFDKWVGTITIKNYLPEDESHVPIYQICDWVKKEIATVKCTLPDKCFYERSDEREWTLYELEPDEKEEYPCQEDMVLGKTVCEPLWENIRCKCLFSSERFSKSGEIFCYIKIHQNGALHKETSEIKSQIEDALDNALIPAKLGCIIGGGNGLQYTYIDIALGDLEKSVVVIKDVLQKKNITRKSWILFFDSELQAEWIGIWDDSPAPPMPNFDEK